MSKLRVISSGIVLLFLVAGCAGNDAVPEPAAEPPASSQTDQESGGDTDKAAVVDTYQADRNKLVCIREKTTGSRIPKRICMTRAERDARREADQQALLDRQTSGIASPGNF